MPLNVTSFASGSSGNATLIRSNRTRLLIDAGIGPRTLTSALRQYGMTVGDLDAIAITHEHWDHIKGLAPAINAGVPVLASVGSVRGLDLKSSAHVAIAHDRTTEISDLTVTALGVSHDAAEPLAYLVQHADGSVILLTDLGCTEPHHRHHLSFVDLAIVESNHDEHLLRRGPYPAHVKRRVASDLGHLENRASAALLAESLAARTVLPTIWLGHLSDTNNRPAMAVEAATAALHTVNRAAVVIALPRKMGHTTWSSDPEQRTPVQAPLLLPG